MKCKALMMLRCSGLEQAIIFWNKNFFFSGRLFLPTLLGVSCLEVKKGEMKAKLIHLGEIVNFFLLCCLLFFDEICTCYFFTLKYSSLDNNGLLKNKEVEREKGRKKG